MSSEIYIDQDEILGQTNFDQEGNLDGHLAYNPAQVKRRLSRDYNELDEPILETLKRDLVGIYNKTKIIALPLSSYDIYKVVLRDWDLWGPLLLCTFLAFELNHSGTHDEKYSGPQFSDVFVLVWFGSCVVSLNYRLLSVSSVNTHMISKNMLSVNSSSDSQKYEKLIDRKLIDPSLQDKLDPDTKNVISSRIRPHQTLVSPPSMFQLMCVFGYCLVAPCFGLILLKIFSFQRLLFERVIIGLLFGFVWPSLCSTRILMRYQHPNKRALAIYPIGLFYFVLSFMIILSH